MSIFQKLSALADDLNNSASNDGCEDSLVVAGSQELQKLLQEVKFLNELAGTVESKEAEIICDRLVDSEEHAGEAAIPDVAEDAAEIIRRLSAALKATQIALSQAMQHAEESNRFVVQVATLSIWDYNEIDECERPSEGFLDSHCCLMSSIQDARKIREGNQK